MDISDPEYTEALAREKAQIEEFDNLVKEIVRVAPPLWHYLDGNGGHVFAGIFKALKEAGLEFDCNSIGSAANFVGIPYNRPVQIYRKKTISDKIRLKVFARDFYKCKNCGINKNLSVDHIIPESKGRTLDLDNLQTLCRPCNSRKGSKVPV